MWARRFVRAFALLQTLTLVGCHERVLPVPAQKRAPSATDAPAPDAPSEREPPGRSPWSSRAACLAELGAGRRAPRLGGRARIATFNVRWFPDGRPGRQRSEPGTDVEWLACALSWLDADVIAVQEFKAHAAAREELARLLGLMSQYTRGEWQARLDGCPNGPAQHVGLLFDARRVRAGSFHVYAGLNPRGDACAESLRPGFGGYFRFPGGLDLHVVSVHAKSGNGRRALELRARALSGLSAVPGEARAVVDDADVLVVGDFNTMGCAHCSPKLSAEGELSSFDALVEPGLRRVAAEPGCSHYFGAHPTLLDHFVVSRSMTELPNMRAARVYGDCAELGCRTLRHGERRSDSALALSDHCPVVLELDDVDAD